jgi:DNA-binding transcriptional MerR regulator
MAEEYTLEDLERLSGLPVRTLRFYIQEGLLPGPDTRGKFARYSRKHFATLEFIRRMKSMRLPLQQIRQLLDSMSTEEVKDMLSASLNTPTKFDQDLVGEDHPIRFKMDKTDEMKNFNFLADQKMNFYLKEDAPKQYGSPMPALSPKLNSPPPQTTDRQMEETWQRIRLVEGVELQVRKPLDRETALLVAELRLRARKFFEANRWTEDNETKEDF